jgi:hypothetical protein
MESKLYPPEDPIHDSGLFSCQSQEWNGFAELPEGWTFVGNAREAVTREEAAREEGVARGGTRGRAREAARDMADMLAVLVYGPDNQDQFSPNSVKAIKTAIGALDWEARQA